jgi:hypothetical protein
MGGGGGKGGGGKDKAGKALAEIAQQFFRETEGLRGGLIGQFEEALNTGGVEARMPVIQKAQERSRQATSSALAQTQNQLAQSGLAGTPFAEMIQGGMLQQGAQQRAGIPTEIISQMLQQIPGFVTGANQTIIQGMGQAAGAEAQRGAQGPAWLSALMSPFSIGF